MYAIIFAVLALFGASSATPKANSYVDAILYGPLINELRNQDLVPAPLSDFTRKWQDKVLFVKYNVTADYKQGRFFGLDNVRRYRECYGPSYTYGQVNYNCTISFDYLSATHKMSIKYGKLPKVSINVTANITRTLMNVLLSAPSNSYVASVSRLDFQLVGQVNPKYTGLGPLSKQLKFLSDSYRSPVSADIVSTMNNRFRYALNKAAAQVQIPR